MKAAACSRPRAPQWLDEGLHLVVPAVLEHGIGMQEHQPFAAGRSGRARAHLLAAPTLAAHDLAAHLVGDARAQVGGAAIGDDDLRNHSVRRRVDQRGQARGKRAFGVQGRDDDAQHGAPYSMVQRGTAKPDT